MEFFEYALSLLRTHHLENVNAQYTQTLMQDSIAKGIVMDLGYDQITIFHTFPFLWYCADSARLLTQLLERALKTKSFLQCWMHTFKI